MAGNGCPSQVFTNEAAGFSQLLSVIARIAIDRQLAPRHWDDEAIGMLVQYLMAPESAFNGLVDDLVVARMEAQARPPNRTELLGPAPPRSCPSSSSSCAPSTQPVSHQLPTLE